MYVWKCAYLHMCLISDAQLHADNILFSLANNPTGMALTYFWPMFSFHIPEHTRKPNRSSRPEVFFKKGVLRNFVKFIKKRGSGFIENETLTQVFSCECYEISKDTFSYKEHLWWLLLTKCFQGVQNGNIY